MGGEAMQISDHKIAVEFILHTYIVTHRPKIISKVKETGWPDPTHYYIAALLHKEGEDKECKRIKEIGGLHGKNTPCEPYFCLMEVTNELIDKLANLSRLSFTDEEKISLKSDLEKMISFIDKLNELDTSGVEPLLHMTDNVDMLRNDEVKNMISREEALKNAPMQDEQFFKVPKVIKK